MALVFSFATSARALPGVSISATQFSPADASRTSMDVGGVWSGLADVTATTGDTFRFTLSNSSPTDPAYSLAASVGLPSGFNYVAATAGISSSGAGCSTLPTVSASQTGTTLTFAFTPATFNLPGDCAITLSYGLTVASGTAAGTYGVHPTFDYSNTSGGPLVGASNTTQNILVQAGASTLTVSPNNQTKAPMANALFAPSVCNTGLGGLFDVTIDESGINPNAGDSLQITSISQTAPALTATGSLPTLTLPYLAPGQCFTANVVAQVTGCAAIINPAATTDRTTATAKSVSASVTLDLNTPLLDFTPPGVSVPVSSAGNFTMSVSNTGLGDATQVSLATTLNSVPASVSNVSAGWSYNSGTGTFTYIAGTLTTGASSTLSFDLNQNTCPPPGTGHTVSWKSNYKDGCGNVYKVPSKASSASLGGGTKPVNLTKSAPQRLNLGETGHWDLQISPDALSDLNSTTVDVIDNLPSTAATVTVGAAPSGTSYSCPGGCGPGKTLTWTVPKAALGSGALTLPIDFTVPTSPCSAGSNISNSASVTGEWGPPACTFNSSATATTALALTPGFSTTQSFNVAAGASGTNSFETGVADDGDHVRDQSLGEGEFIPFTNIIEFGALAAGTWASSTYTDDFASLASQTLVPGTLKVAINGGGAIAVPGGSITTSVGSLSINLAFLAGGAYVNSPNVAGTRLVLTYSTTVNDSSLGAGVERHVRSTGVFHVSGAAAGCVAGTTDFTQPLFYTVFKRYEALSVSLPNIIDVCEAVPVTLSVGSAPGNPLGPGWNSLVTQQTTGSYDYITGQTPAYGGSFVGNITYAENAGTNPTFTFGTSPVSQSSAGSTSFNVRLKATSGTSASALTAKVDFDDTQTQVGSRLRARSFTANGSSTPAIVRKGALTVLVTPSNYTVLTDQAMFSIYVVNGGDGVAFGATLRDVIPAGLTPNSVATNTANPGHSVTVSGQTMDWSLGDMAPGASQLIMVVADVAGTVCSIAAGSNTVTAKWGCGGLDAETITSHLPNFSFPAGQVQAVHDTSATTCSLCDSGSLSYDILVIRNTGTTHVYDMTMSEILNAGTTGIDIAGTPNYQVSTDGGATWSATSGPVSGNGNTATPYFWDKTAVPALADIAPSHDVRVKFALQVSQLANGAPSIQMTSSGKIACGNAVSSPGVSFAVPVKKPNITLSKTGRNTTTGGSAAKTVYGKPGDTVEWQVSIQNNGNLASANQQFTETLPATGVASATLTGPGHAGTALTSGVGTTLPNISNSATASYTVTQTLGGTCVNQNNTAETAWGCSATAPFLTTPTKNSDTAALVMNPDFSGAGITQSWTSLNNGRGEISIVITNNGAVAGSVAITDTLLSGFRVDPTFTPTVTGSGGLTWNNQTGTTTVPIFNLSGTLEHGMNATLKFRVYQTANFASRAKPTPPAAFNNHVSVGYQNGCANATAATNDTTLDPLTPWVSLAVSPGTQVVAANVPQTYTFTLKNDGDSGSVADHVTFTPTLGAGWTTITTTVTTGNGTHGACSGTCTEGQIGTLAYNGTVTITVLATPTTGGPLTLSGNVVHTLFDNGGTTTGNNLSNEVANVRVAGFAQSMTRVSSSESFTTAPDTAIGEEETWRLRVEWFGGDPGDAASGFKNITVRDSLPTGLGFVSYSATGSNNVTITPPSLVPVATGVVNFAIADIVPPSAGGVFEVDFVARVLNVAGNTNGQSLKNNLGSKFDLFGTTLASNNSGDGFSGTQAALHAEDTITARRPAFTFAKRIRKLPGGTFAATTSANAGDSLEYEVKVTNTGPVAAFNLAISDTLPAKLSLVDGSASGGTFTGNNLAYNEGNTTLPAGSNLAQLDAGNSVTFTYQATVLGTANPLEALVNNAQLAASSLSGPTGSQTAPTGAAGTTTGKAGFTASASATNNVGAIGFSKILNAASIGGTSANVYIGEQIRFRLPIVLPEGTTPSLVVSDSLPSGLALVSTPTPTFGSKITGCNSPVIVPGSLPTSGSPLAISWTFGTCLVDTGGVAADRTITVDYIAQVRNVSANSNGVTLVNNAGYTFTGYTSPKSTVTLTVKVPTISATKTASLTSNAVAGDVITYTVALHNGGTAPAYDVNIDDTLPAGMSFVTASTTPTAPAVLGAPDTSGQHVIWGRTQTSPQTINIVAGGDFNFTYQVKLADTVQPGASLANSLAVDFTTLSGSPGPDLGVALLASGNALGERNGSGGTNNLTASAHDTTTVASGYDLTKVASGDTLAPSGFRIGDLVTYTLTISAQKGTVNGFQIKDTLPSGMAFDSFDAIAPATGVSGYTYTTPTGPTAGATGTITWDLSTLTRAGTSAVGSLSLVYRARIVDASGIVQAATQTGLTNGARVSYADASAVTQTTTTRTSTIYVKQPVLATAKTLAAGQLSTVHDGETVHFRIRVTNSGVGPAYDTRVTDTLPAGMRAATPTTLGTSQLNGAGVTIATPTYNSTTGVIVWTLDDSQILNPSAVLDIYYDAVVDATVGGGLTLSNLASTSAYYSKESASSSNRRNYGATATSSQSVTTPSPTDIDKTADVSVQNIGGTIVYTLTIPKTAVNVTLYDVKVSDTIPANLQLGTITSSNSYTDQTVGNAVALTFASVAANTQTTITIPTTVKNVGGNVAGGTKVNSASYIWSKVAAGPAQPTISLVTPVTTTLQEPNLTISKALKTLTQATPGVLQAGDSITYTITVHNGGTGPAYDLGISDIADQHLITPVVSANPDNPGSATNAGTSGGHTTYTWSVAGPLAANADYKFDLRLTLDGSVQPYQTLGNSAAITYASRPPGDLERRTGSASSSTVNQTTGSVTFAKTETAPAPGVYAVGANVSYDLEMSFISGQLKNVHFIDTLPGGLYFVSASISTTNARRTGGGAVTIVSGPSAGAASPLDFSLGDVESTGANPKVKLTVVARVLDIPGNVAGTTLTNSATSQIDDSTSGTHTIPAAATPTVTVIEPALVLGLDGPATVALATTALFTARVNNTGNSPGYLPTIQIQLPSEMQATDPTTLTGLAATINRAGTLTLVPTTDYTASYNSGTGVFTIAFTSSRSYVTPAETLTVTIPAALNNNTANGLSRSLVGTVTQWKSQDTSPGGPHPDVRVKNTALAVGSVGTANGVLGNDPTDDAGFTTNTPVVAFTKAVNHATANPGDSLTYTLSIHNTGTTPLTGIVLADDLNAAFKAGTLTSSTPASGTVTITPAGGANGTGRFALSGASVAVGATLSFDITAQLKPVLRNGLVVPNTATFTATGYDITFTSNTPTTTIQSAPVLTFTKVSSDVNGAPLAMGDVLQYTLVLSNSGNENVKSAVMKDAIPANSTYVAGSTTLNGTGVADVGGTTPLVAGMAINGAGDAAGWLSVGKTATITFQTKVDASVAVGTVIRNQGKLNGKGEGDAVLPTKLSDDPRTSQSPDPTIDVVGNVPLLAAAKTVVDLDTAPTAPGHHLEYTITVRNVGATTAHNVAIKDSIPASTTYFANHLAYSTPARRAFTPLTDGSDGDAGDFNVTTAGAITVRVGDLPAGQETSVKFRVTVNAVADGTVIANQGKVFSSELPPIPTDALGTLNAATPTTTVVGSLPKIVATKTAVGSSGGVLKAGDTVHYTITLQNVGAVDALSVVATDPLPPTPTTYVAGSTTLNGVAVPDVSGVSKLVTGVPVGTIAKGATATVEASVLIPDGTPTPTVIANTATYTGTGLSGSTNEVKVQTGAAPDSADVRGTVWLDTNHDRVLNSGEPLLAGWTVEVVRDGKVVASTLSGSDGKYEIQGLIPGDGYELRFRHPDSGAVFGGVQSHEPGVELGEGTIKKLTLPAGISVFDQNLPLDPNGVVYDAITRKPITGVQLRFTGPPGFDPLTMLGAGQEGQITGADGFYRFDLQVTAPNSNEYRIQVAAPNGYLPFPSTTIAPQTGFLPQTGGTAPLAVQPQSDAPQLGMSTTYWQRFELNPQTSPHNDVVNNHIPLDPILKGAIQVIKTTPLQNVTVGGLVPYTIVAKNTTTATLGNIDLIDLMPAGFKYAANSAHVDGKSVLPVVNGRNVTFKSLNFTGGQSLTIKLVLIVGGGVNEGLYTNEAWAMNTLANTEVSNHATAMVRVMPDPTFDCPDLIGKVFDDKNLNGVQDEGEKGLPGVRLATARGWLITSDEFGRFHVTCPMIPNSARGSNFILKVDERTLPSGYRITTENPRVIRLTRGKMSKIDFGAAIHRVVRLEVKDEAFVAGGVQLKPEWQDKLALLVPTLRERPSVLRLAYWSAKDERGLVKQRLAEIRSRMTDLWKRVEKKAQLQIEEEMSWAKEGVHE